MLEQEKYNVEFKESVTNTFLKTVSAFANYNDGKIIFGIADDGTVVGIESLNEEKLRIENKINDSIDPIPTYKLGVETQAGQDIIVLEVFQGQDTPYYYQGKAYRRSDTATIPVGRQELNRLVLSGMYLNYEDHRAGHQNLTFSIFEEKMIEIVGIEKLSLDILKTLNLYDRDDAFNIAAELLSDHNQVPLSGIDIVKFSADPNKILYRKTLEGSSILRQYDQAIELFEQYYQYEEIAGYSRIQKELIPKEAFREAVANAIVHREWDIQSHIQISMYDDRIEINSPGDLPLGMTEEAYLHEQVSNLRNPIIASVFHRLKLIEAFGTGVRRIKAAYQDSFSKPKFQISSHHIKVTLPLYEEALPDLVEEEMMVYNVLKSNDSSSRVAIEEATGYERSKVLRTMKELMEKDLVTRVGSGPSTAYRVKK